MARFSGLKVTAGCLGFAFLVAAGVYIQDDIHSAEKGRAFLIEKGYTGVQGGAHSTYFNTCGQNVLSRSYEAISPKGEPVEQTVCFGVFGPYRPLFG